MHLGHAVKQIARSEKRVVDDKGDVFTYQKLLLATGGRPRCLPFGDDRIIYFPSFGLPASARTHRDPDVCLQSSVAALSVRRSRRP